MRMYKLHGGPMLDAIRARVGLIRFKKGGMLDVREVSGRTT